MMLPRPKIESEEEDPRAELAAQLLAYAAVKQIAVWLIDREETEARSFTRDPEYFRTREKRNRRNSSLTRCATVTRLLERGRDSGPNSGTNRS